jgi:hypothetical protein
MKAVLDLQRQQIRIGEIAIIVGLFLAAHGAGFTPVGIIQAGFLHHLAASSIRSIWRSIS